MSAQPRLLVLRDLDEWSSPWDQLVDVSPLPSPFLRSWWLNGTGGPERRFLLVVDDGHLIGGLAVEEETRLGLPCLRIMGDGALCPDHMDVLVSPEHADVAIRILTNWLCRSGGRLVDLNGIRAGSRLSEALPGPVHQELLAVAPFTPLPDSPEAYVAGLSSQFRRNLRKSSARLEEEGATHRTHRGPTLARPLDDLRRLHQAQWGHRSKFLTCLRSVCGRLCAGRGRG